MFLEGEQSGVRYRIHRDDQVLRLGADDPLGAELARTPHQARGSSRFVSAALLATKAKQVDDGLYAAVELAAQRGAGSFAGKLALLHGLLAHLSGDGEARATLDAASSLGGTHACSPGLAARIRDGFLADELKSKPLGFYTWSDELARIFRQDRLLQSDLSQAPDLRAVAKAVRSDATRRATYEGSLRLAERLTGGVVSADLRDTVRALDLGASPIIPRPLAFLPASRAHETELMKRLFGDAPIPDGFDLSKELVRRVRERTVDLTPAESSGWYDLQTWALETLIAPERGLEANRLELDESYVTHLEDLFRGILAATRETHVKQLEIALAGGAPPREVKLRVRPHLTVEPLVTYYERRADSYRFVRAVLVEIFGEQALGAMHGLRAGGPVDRPLGVELATMVHLFDGAAATAMRELGIATEWDTSTFEAWRGGGGDADVDADIRTMVPVFYDQARRKTKVWMILGWVHGSLHASFAKPPRVELLDGARAEIELAQASYPLATPVMVETYVSRLLDRDELRALCDEHRTADAILASL
jgi:hypothetical protein